MRLVVCLEGEVAGALETSGLQATFTYSQSWLGAPGSYPISQSLPLQPLPLAGTSVVNFLWGLLPDNERTLDAWARQFRVSARNPAALLAHVGEDCAGAIQFVTEERLPAVLSSGRRAAEIEWLSDRDLESRIVRLAVDSGAGRTSTHEGQFSLAGAQAKTALYFDAARKRWGVPSGRTPTTHILKPASADFAGFVENEHFCLTLARRAGIAAALTSMEVFGDIPTLIVERYDRIRAGKRWRRIHQEDCCQALGVHPGAKYEADGGPGFARIMPLLDATDDPETDRDRLMWSACWAYLIAATDMHAKNFSLLYSRGKSRPSMRLAPFYDMASAWPYGRALQLQKLKLAMRIGKHYRLREILPRHFRDLARACQYPPDRLLDLLSTLARRLPDEAAGLARTMTGRRKPVPMLSALVDGIARQCASVLRNL